MHGVPWLGTQDTKFEGCSTSRVQTHHWWCAPVVCTSTKTIPTPTQRPRELWRYASKETSHALDGNPRGVHVDRDDFDTGTDDSGSRVMSTRTPCFSRLRMRVADVRKNSIADGCTRTARLG